MSDDYRVAPLSDKEVRQLAQQTKVEYGTANRRPVNVIRCLESGSIQTKLGRRDLVYKVVDDHEMGDKDGRTEFTPTAVIITVKRSVHEKAKWGDGRSRMTLAHELAHGVLHYGGPMYRGSQSAGFTRLSRTNAAVSAEHQAKVFAAAFLIDDEAAATLSSAEEISIEFGVSFEAAQICFERLTEEAGRAEAAERVRRSNELYQASMRKPRQQLKYNGDLCGSCGNATLIPMGVKALCHSCGAITDLQ